MMRKRILLATAAALAVLPAFAGPTGSLPGVLRGTTAQLERPQLVWWHAGGTTAWGNHWHASGTGGYGAWRGGYAGGYAHGWADSTAYHGYYRAPVPVTPWYHPAATAAAVAGTAAVVGGLSAAATASYVANSAPKPPSQPTTVINNYYD